MRTAFPNRRVTKNAKIPYKTPRILGDFVNCLENLASWRFKRETLSGRDQGGEAWVGNAVMVAVAGGVAVGGGEEVDVAVPVEVPVGTLVEVGIFVDVDGAIVVDVAGRVPVTLGKMMMTGVSVAVAVARGVRVTTFGTQMTWPVTRLYW